NDRVEDEAAAAWLPLRPRGMIAQPGNVAPRLAVVIAAEQSGRLHADMETAACADREAPSRLDRLLAFRICQTLTRMRPRTPEIGRLPHSGTEPFIPACGVDGSGCSIGDDMVDRPRLTKRPPELPGAAPGIAFQNECALFRAEEY